MIAVGNSFTNLHKQTFALSIWALLMFWTPGIRRGGHHWELESFTQTLQGRDEVQEHNFFSQQINKPSTEGDFEATGCGEPAHREGVQQVRKGLCHSRGQGVAPCDLSLVSEVLLGKYNYPGFGVSSPMFSKNQDSGGSTGPVCGRRQVSSKKWWEKMMVSVTVLTSGPWSTAKWTCRNVFQKEEKQGRSSWTHNNQPLL